MKNIPFFNYPGLFEQRQNEYLEVVHSVLKKGAYIKENLDHIDTSNIICGKRTRRSAVRYVDEIMKTQEVQKLMMDDIPESELDAALVDEDFSQDEEEDDPVVSRSDSSTPCARVLVTLTISSFESGGRLCSSVLLMRILHHIFN